MCVCLMAAVPMPGRMGPTLLSPSSLSYGRARQPARAPYVPDAAKYIFALKFYVQKLIRFTSHLSRDILVFVLKNQHGLD